jgi:hypothetical protein
MKSHSDEKPIWLDEIDRSILLNSCWDKHEMVRALQELRERIMWRLSKEKECERIRTTTTQPTDGR